MARKPEEMHVVHLQDHDNSYVHGQCSRSVEVLEGMLHKLGYKLVEGDNGVHYQIPGSSCTANIKTLMVID
jgi:hypothetical protein